MNQHFFLPPLRRRTTAALVFLIATCSQVQIAAATSASEHTHLETMIRQLNALEDTARRSAKVEDEPGKRFYFDYPRLAGDIARIRIGIENYLSPTRAQPRDPVELSGKYTKSGPNSP